MKIVLISLEDVVKTEINGSEKLDKTDKIIILYRKNKDNLSVPVFSRLSTVKCNVEFVEIFETANTHDFETKIAYLTGLNINKGTVYVIDTSKNYTSLGTYCDIPLYANIDSALTGKRNVVNSLAAKPVTTVKKADEKKERQVVEKKPRERKTTKDTLFEKRDEQMGRFKKFLKSCKTADFDPSDYEMSLFMSIKQAIVSKTKSPVSDGIKKALIETNTVKKAEKAFAGKEKELEEIVTAVISATKEER